MRLGAGHYEIGCAPCHGSPVEPQNPVPAHMLPVPPNLHEEARLWEPGELFWIVKHGLKYAGMPAWPELERDDEIEAVTAFLSKFQEIEPEDYRRMGSGPTMKARPDPRRTFSASRPRRRCAPAAMATRTRRLRVFSSLIFAGMIVFALRAIIFATLMLEVERTFGWPFFEAAVGGDMLLWQHLFWFFGHPEVYIIFLPAAGMISMIVPTMARTPLVGYRLIVVALVATGFFSFGLWVNHMFTTGIPALSSGFFSAASMAVAMPSGIQVFAWIATIAAARGRFRLTTPGLFVLGFLFIFAFGGAFILAAGVAVFILDVIRSVAKKADAENNPWGAGSL